MHKKRKRRVHHKKALHKKVRHHAKVDDSVSGKITYLILALVIIILGFYAIKNFEEVSIGKAYEIVLKEEEFTRSLEVELLANTSTEVLIIVENIVKNASFKLSGSGSDIEINIGDNIIFTYNGSIFNQTFLVDFSVVINEQCTEYPCVAVLNITSETDGLLNLSNIAIEIEAEAIEEEIEVEEEEAVPDDSPITKENKTIIKNGNFILTGPGNNGPSFTLKYMGADKMISDNPLIRFKDLGSGDIIEILLSAGTYTAGIFGDAGQEGITELTQIKIGGGVFRVFNLTSTKSNDFDILVDLDGDGRISKSEEEPAEGQACETSLDCPIYNKCEEGVCVNFCGEGEEAVDEGAEDAPEDSESGSEAAVSKLNELGYDVIGQITLAGFQVEKSGNRLIFSSELKTKVYVFDDETESFVILDNDGNIATITKRQGESDEMKPKASHIVQLNEKSLLKVRSELEKEFTKGVQGKKIQKSIRDRIKSSLDAYNNRLKDAKIKALEEMLEIDPDIESKIVNSYKNVFNGLSLNISEEEASQLRDLPSVKNVYRNREVKAVLEESVNQIGANELWKLTDENEIAVTGVGVTIGIIDTGVDYTHEDLGGCLGEECKVIGGYDFINNDNDPMDDHGHGTHVAATAAGNGILKGVAPDAKIVAYKVLDAGGRGSWDGIIAAIERSVDPDQDGNFDDHLDIISLSLGSRGNPDDPVSLAIDNAVDAGVVAVVAAGNSGPSPETIGSPGTARKAITVGAVDKCDNIAGFSSRGSVSWEGGILLKPDLVAPGVAICAAQFDGWLSGRRCKDDRHIAIDGTSMATPHVSGAAALLLQAHTEWTPDMVKSALMATSLDLGFKLMDQGAGRMDIPDAYNTGIVTYPSSISFEFESGQTERVETVTIQNLLEESVTVKLEITELKDGSGQSYDFASLNTTELVIDGNSAESFDFIINTPTKGGIFIGKILATHNSKSYTIPFVFDVSSKLTVKAIGTDKKLAPDFKIHNGDLSYVKLALQDWDFIGDNFTFKVSSGEFTVYAVGDFGSVDHEYVLMDIVEVPILSDIKVELRLADARPFTVKAESLQGKPLKLNEWVKGFKTYDGNNLVSYEYSHPWIVGDRTVYISNKPDNGLDTDVVLYYYGIPAREEDLE